MWACSWRPAVREAGKRSWVGVLCDRTEQKRGDNSCCCCCCCCLRSGRPLHLLTRSPHCPLRASHSQEDSNGDSRRHRPSSCCARRTDHLCVHHVGLVFCRWWMVHCDDAGRRSRLWGGWRCPPSSRIPIPTTSKSCRTYARCSWRYPSWTRPPRPHTNTTRCHLTPPSSPLTPLTPPPTTRSMHTLALHWRMKRTSLSPTTHTTRTPRAHALQPILTRRWQRRNTEKAWAASTTAPPLTPPGLLPSPRSPPLRSRFVSCQPALLGPTSSQPYSPLASCATPSSSLSAGVAVSAAAVLPSTSPLALSCASSAPSSAAPHPSIPQTTACSSVRPHAPATSACCNRLARTRGGRGGRARCTQSRRRLTSLAPSSPQWRKGKCTTLALLRRSGSRHQQPQRLHRRA